MDQPDGCSAIRILLVDDEPSFRTSLAEMLREDGHGVGDHGAPAHVPALSSLKDVAILITDYEMPGTSGLALADAFHAQHPHVPVILVTAYRTTSLDAQVLDRPFLRFVQKPVDYVVLHTLIHEVCAGRRP
ncbi:MAG TPA: response regulator [Candidatus Binatia bacterium]|jgi:DNA-binding NtrC family response regulator